MPHRELKILQIVKKTGFKIIKYDRVWNKKNFLLPIKCRIFLPHYLPILSALHPIGALRPPCLLLLSAFASKWFARFFSSNFIIIWVHMILCTGSGRLEYIAS